MPKPSVGKRMPRGTLGTKIVHQGHLTYAIEQTDRFRASVEGVLIEIMVGCVCLLFSKWVEKDSDVRCNLCRYMFSGCQVIARPCPLHQLRLGSTCKVVLARGVPQHGLGPTLFTHTPPQRGAASKGMYDSTQNSCGREGIRKSSNAVQASRNISCSAHEPWRCSSRHILAGQ